MSPTQSWDSPPGLGRTSTNRPGVQREQPPQPGRELRTGTDDRPHPSIGAQPAAAFTSQPNSCFPLFTSFWILGTSAERGTCSSHPVVASKSRKRNSKAENRMAWSSQGKTVLFPRKQSRNQSSPSLRRVWRPPPWNQTGKNQLLLSARRQIPCQVVRTRLRKRHSPTLGEITDKWENIEKGVFSI